MSNNQIIKPTSADAAKFTYGPLRPLPTNTKVKFISARLNGGMPVVQTPVLVTMQGFKAYTDAAEGRTSYSIEASFPFVDRFGSDDYDESANPSDPNQAQGTFYNFIRSLERHNVSTIARNSLEYLKNGKTYTEEQVRDDKYSPMLKYSRDKDTKVLDGKWAPTMKLKVQFPRGGEEESSDGKARGSRLMLFDHNKEALPVTEDTFREYIGKGTKFSAIIQFTGMWLGGGKLCPSWKVVQLRVHNARPQPMVSYAFIDDETEEHASALATPARGGAGGRPSRFVDDGLDKDASDDEEDDDLPPLVSVSNAAAPAAAGAGSYTEDSLADLEVSESSAAAAPTKSRARAPPKRAPTVSK